MEGCATKVLIVDDEPQVCKLIHRRLTQLGFECWPATEPQRAMELFDTQRFDVVVSDVSMPGTSGFDILAQVRRRSPSCKVILITGYSSREYASQAIMMGAFDYLEKPFDFAELADVVSRASTEGSTTQLPGGAATEIEVSGRMKRASFDSVRALAHAVEAKDPFTRRHSDQVTHYAVNLAEEAGLSAAMTETIRVAAFLHDIGKIGVPDVILNKIGPLSEEEFGYVRRHPAIGADILKNITMFSQEAILVRHHHEDWSGTGYPDGLASEDIPLGSRIIRIADSIDGMLMDRSYKQGCTVEKMINELERCSGSHFDPKMSRIAAQWCSANPDKLVLPKKPVPVAS